VSDDDRVRQLLSGPRGRRVCLHLADLQAELGRWPPLRWSEGPTTYPVGRLDPAGIRASLVAGVAATDLTVLAATTRSEQLLDALLESVDAARYWQEPFEADQLLADDGLAEVLIPIAQAVVRAPASRWWAEPMAAAGQHVVGWPRDEPALPPATTGAPAALQRWRADTLVVEERAARERPADPSARWSGIWWSTPAMAGLVVTTRARPGIAVDGPAPVGLLLVEDEMGWQTARSWPVRPPATARVLELTGPGDWTALVARHPLDVSHERRHDWWRVTGWDGAWAIPDWSAVAREFDAVHLTVDGYLSTAGRALPVDVPGFGGPVRTLLGGWDPDATWWLADVLPGLGKPTDWCRRDDDPPRWAAVG
jgi:hypothetical protein